MLSDLSGGYEQNSGNGNGLAVPTLGKKCFFIWADYAFGAVKAAGGEVVGSVEAPLGKTKFSSFVLQAQALMKKFIERRESAPSTFMWTPIRRC